jgi:diadenosine tetraphosphate (Ap4A) HIT family hydrolase
MDECPFCNVKNSEIILESKHSFAIYDRFPVNAGHILIIPKQHNPNYFSLTQEEKNDVWKLVDKASSLLSKKFSPSGFNIGININKSAGQTIPHVHVHIIPRYKNDVDDPTGGVRGVIPSKQKY